MLIDYTRYTHRKGRTDSLEYKILYNEIMVRKLYPESIFKNILQFVEIRYIQGGMYNEV